MVATLEIIITVIIFIIIIHGIGLLEGPSFTTCALGMYRGSL